MTQRFTSRADVYDAGRPTYAHEAIDALLDGTAETTTLAAEEVDRDGFGARLRSSSYLPHDGSAALRLHAEADEVFARFARDGAVAPVTTLVVAPTPR